MTGTSENAKVPYRCRHEIKYLISEAKACAIMSGIRPLMAVDSHASKTDGIYPIVSLYLDADNLQLFRESKAGLKNRFKLRIRSYSDDPAYPQFFEIKRRANGLVLKSHAAADLREVAPLLLGQTDGLERGDDPNGAVLQQFLMYARNLRAKPILRTRYMRQAFEIPGGSDLRITFDRELCVSVTQTPDTQFHTGHWQRIPMRDVLMEVKFTGQYPSWLSDLVRRFNLRQQSFCKYAMGVEQTSLLRFCAPKSMGFPHGPVGTTLGRSFARQQSVFTR